MTQSITMWRGWRSERGWDLALAALVLFLQSVPFLFTERTGFTGRMGADRHWTLVEYLPALISALPVIWRRHAPLLCLIVTYLSIAAYAVLDSGPQQPVWYGGLVGMYTVAVLARPSHRIAALVLAAVGIVLAVGSIATGVREYLTFFAAYALGALTRTRKELAWSSARQAAELATERERNRIARDLHDILGHAFSLMVVQAEAGAAVARRDPGRAELAFDAIAGTGRTAMTQLRGTVGTLRAGSAADSPRNPQPTLADLPELVRQAEQAGLAVTLATVGQAREPAADTQLAVYRIVQESLTNVVRHARATAVTITLTWAETFRIEIVDNGAGAVGTAAGHGLIGIRERVAAGGGTVTFGPGGQPSDSSTGRGFAVRMEFP